MTEYTLITGASSGIGRALASEFARHGENLILVARRPEALRQVAEELRAAYPVRVVTIAVDLTQAAAASQLAAVCRKRQLPVTTLVNNAGCGAQGHFAALPLARQEAIIRLNDLAVVRLCHAFLPAMEERSRGTVVNIASTTAFMPLANEAVYAASKAFILSFSQALTEEERPAGIAVCTLCPGVTKTNFFKDAGFSLANFKVADPNDFATFAYRQVKRKRPLAVHRLPNRVLATGSRLFPRGAVRRLAAHFG